MNFSILKKFLARARAQNILPSELKYHDFWVFTAIWDLARAKNFFRIVKFVKKSRCNFFLFDHNSKSKFFRALWSLKFFFENSIFSKKFWIWKILKNFKIFLDFTWKNPIFKSIYSNRFKRYKNFENT